MIIKKMGEFKMKTAHTLQNKCVILAKYFATTIVQTVLHYAN